jgi:two-component system chemotaxis response regulator CheB
MDFEMPVMDGVTAIKLIMAHRPVPILMFSSLTYEGARITLDALAAGAMDFIPKNFAEVSRDSEVLKSKLHERLLTLARAGSRNQSAAVVTTKSVPSSIAPTPPPASLRAATIVPSVAKPVVTEPANSTASAVDGYKLKKQPKLIVIGASTGGPIALTDVLIALPENFPLPILLIQHMPENFTKAFAERLNKACKIRVREAVSGDSLEPGLALLAPGGKQFILDKSNPGRVKVLSDDDRLNYKPSLDITFASAANTYADKVLGIVLTGMGSDGCKGARILKEAGSALWSQDEASSLIYGMPMAVAQANLTDKVLALKDIGPRLAREVK